MLGSIAMWAQAASATGHAAAVHAQWCQCNVFDSQSEPQCTCGEANDKCYSNALIAPG
jgi:hypothetical protein